MTEQDRENTAHPVWEVGVRNDLGDWEHYHPNAADEDAAEEMALDEASGVGLNTLDGALTVYMVEGPFDE